MTETLPDAAILKVALRKGLKPYHDRNFTIDTPRWCGSSCPVSDGVERAIEIPPAPACPIRDQGGP